MIGTQLPPDPTPPVDVLSSNPEIVAATLSLCELEWSYPKSRMQESIHSVTHISPSTSKCLFLYPHSPCLPQDEPHEQSRDSDSDT
jgi:hypothetical protein